MCSSASRPLNVFWNSERPEAPDDFDWYLYTIRNTELLFCENRSTSSYYCILVKTPEAIHWILVKVAQGNMIKMCLFTLIQLIGVWVSGALSTVHNVRCFFVVMDRC